jgi:hypothetical protein
MVLPANARCQQVSQCVKLASLRQLFFGVPSSQRFLNYMRYKECAHAIIMRRIMSRGFVFSAADSYTSEVLFSPCAAAEAMGNSFVTHKVFSNPDPQ